MNSAFEKLWLRTEPRTLLNDPSFVRVIEQVYKIKSMHFAEPAEGGEMGMPAFHCRSLLGGHKVTSMPFNWYPPVVNPIDEIAGIKALIERTKQFGDKCYLEYKTFTRLTAEQEKELALVRTSSSLVSNLSIASTHEEQQKGYNKSLRQNLRTTLRRAEESGVTMSSTRSEDDLKQWFHLLVRLYRNKHQMITQPFALYQQLLANIPETTLYVAKRGDKVLCGIFVLRGVELWDYAWAASDQAEHKLGLNTLLVDHAIKDATETPGTKTFSFGSTPPTDEKLLYFKERWGCEHTPMNYYYWNTVPKAVNLDTSYGFARTVLSKLPPALLKHVSTLVVPLLA